MQAYKTFKNLSDSEKIKFFEVLKCLNDVKKSTPFITEKLSPDHQKSDLNTLLGHLKCETKNITKESVNSIENSPSAESRKKQKNLDGWLIKKHIDASSSNKNEIAGTVQTENISLNVLNNKVKGRCSSSSTHNDATNSFSPSHNFSTESLTLNKDAKSSNFTGENKVMLMTNDRSKISLSGETSYNLRRSKRKLSKLTAYDETGDSSTKHKVYSGDNSSYTKKHKSEKDFKNIFTENKKDKSNQLSQNVRLSSQSINYFDSDLHGNYNIVLSPENNNSLKNFNICINGSSVNKTSCNHRTKKKITQKLQDAIESRNIVSRSSSKQHILSNPVDHVIESNVNPVINSSPQFHYEAFCKISAVCNQFDLDIHDILDDEKIQNILSRHKNDTPRDGIILIGTHKTSIGKTLPVVHIHVSESKLLENLYESRKVLLNKK